MEKIAKVLKSLEYQDILDKIGVQLCENLHRLKDILISFHIFFIS